MQESSWSVFYFILLDMHCVYSGLKRCFMMKHTLPLSWSTHPKVICPPCLKGIANCQKQMPEGTSAIHVPLLSVTKLCAICLLDLWMQHDHSHPPIESLLTWHGGKKHVIHLLHVVHVGSGCNLFVCTIAGTFGILANHQHTKVSHACFMRLQCTFLFWGS